MTLRNFIYAVLFLYPAITLGQVKTDTAYIADYPQRVMLSGFISQSSVQLGKDEKDYIPNNPLRAGVGISIKNTVINFSYSFGIAPLEQDGKGKTKSSDLQIHHYGRYFVLDLFYQKYKGFYNDAEGDEATLYPDMYVRNLGAEFAYIFNGDKFSAKAAFQQNEIQLKSVGSFILGGGAYFFKVNPGGVLWETENSLKNVQFGINGGYAYSWVIDERWMATGILTVGVNVGNDPHLLSDWKIEVYPTAFGRGGLIYHKNDWALAATFLVNNKLMYTEDDGELSFTGINFQLSFVKHIDF